MAWTPSYVHIPVLGYDTYLTVFDVNRAAYITRVAGAVPFTVYYCDGHQKVVKTFATLAAAQTYLTKEVIAGD